MKVQFTNLIKASQFGDQNFKKKIINGFSKLISNNQFIGGKTVDKFEKDFTKFIKVQNCISVVG